jgi:hypothetical protein
MQQRKPLVRTFRLMPKVTITIAPITLQTSRGDGWFVHGLAIGAGDGPR